MSHNVKTIPDGYHTVTPYLIVRGAAAALDFYKKIFASTEVVRFPAPGDKIGHAEILIGDSKLMLADECPEMAIGSPQKFGGSPVSLHVYVENVDATFNEAVRSGAKVIRPVEDKFYGDRTGMFEDPFGHVWSVATHKEDVTEDELQRRAGSLFGDK